MDNYTFYLLAFPLFLLAELSFLKVVFLTFVHTTYLKDLCFSSLHKCMVKSYAAEDNYKISYVKCEGFSFNIVGTECTFS